MASNSKAKPVPSSERSGGATRTATTLPVSYRVCPYSAQIDNNPARQLSAQSTQTHSSLLVGPLAVRLTLSFDPFPHQFRQDNLASGNHTLVVTNRGGGFGSLAIGSATPIIWSDGSSPSSSPSASSSNSPNVGVIAGAVVAAVVVLAVVLIALLWFLRRRRQAQDTKGHDVVRPTTNESAFIDATPFVLPPAQTQSASSVRGSKVMGMGDDPTMSGMSVYRALPGSPGMSSRGSFDYGNGGMGVPGSSSAGTSVGWAAASGAGSGSGWARGGKERTHSGPTTRHEIDEDSLRDRDAGPMLLPQLPPAYSSVTAGASAVSDPASDSGPSLAPPIPETVQGGGVFQSHAGSSVTATTPSPRPGPV
ncbi:hypothetical protein FRC08_014334 [Ceratobasidium sp. 394]|nr:hypothetical protein FRC08_014334 [Ceratobasidium sp. 394]